MSLQTLLNHGISLLVELSENIGLPQTLFEKHNPWPAYVSYISPVVRRLTDKSRIQELESMHAAEESCKLESLSKSSLSHLERKKPSRSSGTLTQKDTLSETLWEPCSAAKASSILIPDPAHSQMETREEPTSDYNKIIFSRRPAMRKLPYALLQASKEAHTNV